MTDDALPRRRNRRGRRRKRGEQGETNPLYLETGDGIRVLELPSAVAARYRHLHTRLAREDPLPRRLGIIAALRGEGVTPVSLGLATVMAHDMEVRFCVVETNLWWPGLAKHAQVEPVPGLAEMVRGESEPGDVLRPTALENLWLLPAGECEETLRPRLARSRAIGEALDVLDGQFDHLLLDIPAVLATDDAVPLAGLADGLCLLVRQGATPIPLARQALDQVEHLSIRGVVLNGDKTTVPRWLLRLVGGGQIR